MVLCFSVSTSAAALSAGNLTIPLKNVSEEIFDGYTGLETTISGKVGYNYDLITADSSHTVLIGFNPNMAESYFDDVYNIGTGWQVKLPYLDLAEKRLYQTDGYSFAFTTDKNAYSVKNYPGIAQLTKNDVCCFEKADGSKEYFSDSGSIIQSIDAFGNETKYQYTNGILSEIIYPENTSIHFLRAQNNACTSVSLVYNTPTESSNFATLSLINDGSNVVLIQFKIITEKSPSATATQMANLH